MERGRTLRWVAGDEALIASRRIPSVKFAIIEPSKEAHDSLVPAFQCRRTRRPRRREPTSAAGPAGHIHHASRDRFVGLPFVGLLAMTARVSPNRHGPSP